MAEPGSRRADKATYQEQIRQTVQANVLRHTCDLLGVHPATTADQLQKDGYQFMQLPVVRQWTNYDGVTQARIFTPDLPYNRETAYVLRGTLVVDRQNELRVHTKGESEAVVRVGPVEPASAALLRAEAFEIVGVIKLDKQERSGEYIGKIDPSVLILPKEIQKTTAELITDLKSAARTSEGRADHTSQRQRLPKVRALVNDLRMRHDLARAQIVEVGIILGLIPVESRPVWGDPADLQVIQEHIDTHNQLIPAIGQRVPIPNIGEISCGELREVMQHVTRTPRPPMGAIHRILQYNFPEAS